MDKYYIDDEVKPKSIIINGDLHDKFKKTCKNKCLKIGGVIENLITLYMSDPIAIQKMIDELGKK